MIALLPLWRPSPHPCCAPEPLHPPPSACIKQSLHIHRMAHTPTASRPAFSSPGAAAAAAADPPSSERRAVSNNPSLNVRKLLCSANCFAAWERKSQIILTTRDMEARDNILPVTYPKFPQMTSKGDTIYIGRYLVSGAEGGSLYLEVAEVDIAAGNVICIAKNEALLDGLLTVFHMERFVTVLPLYCLLYCGVVLRCCTAGSCGGT